MLLAIDSNVLAGLTQAAATIVGVGLGYGLSVLNERANRKHLDEAQRQQRRLAAVVESIDALSSIQDVVGGIAGELAQALDKNAATGTANASKLAAIAGIRRSRADELFAVRRSSQQLSRIALTIDLLGLPEDVKVAAKIASSNARLLVDEVEAAMSGGVETSDALFVRMADVENSVERLLALGRALA